MKRALFAGGFFAFWLLISPALGSNNWHDDFKIAYDVVVAILSAMLYLILPSRKPQVECIPLTTERVKEKAGEFRENNHPGHFTLSKLVKLECIFDFADGSRSIKMGQIVYARQVCERGRWHSRVRLRGGSYWIPVEYFKLAE